MGLILPSLQHKKNATSHMIKVISLIFSEVNNSIIKYNKIGNLSYLPRI